MASSVFKFVLLFICLNVVLAQVVSGQKCTPQYTENNDLFLVRCLNVHSSEELATEIDPTWTKIEIVNRPEAKFTLDDVYRPALNLIEKLDLAPAGRLIIKPTGFYSFESLMQLNLTSSYLNQLQLSWFERINFIESIDYSHNGMVSLTRSDLQLLTKLKVGNFSNNGIANIERDTFADLKRLETLVLNHNGIPQLTFGEVTGLKYLDIRNNHLTEIRNGSFTRMNKLERLLASENYIGAIHDYAFTGLANSLKFVNLSSNSITHITALTFSGLERGRLAELDLHENDIDDIAPNGFAQLKSLLILDLSHNSLSELNSSIFVGLTNIRKLYLQDNDIIKLYPNVFDGMVHLDTLDISQNGLLTVSSDMWGTSGTKLKRLLLYHNSIGSIDADVFRNTVLLEYLDVSINNLVRLDDTLFQSLINIRRIYLNNNYIVEFSSPLMNSIGSIVEFHVTNNKLTFFPDVDQGFPKLIRLGLDQNPWQCQCINDILSWAIQRKIDYKKKGFTDGTKPMCVVTPVDICVKDMQLVEDNQVVNKFEAAQIRVAQMQ